MSMRRVILAAAVLVLLSRGPVPAQEGTGLYGGPAAPDTSAASGSPEEAGTPPVTSTVLPAQPSPWILGTCPECCGPLTDGNPAKTELYLRSGIASISGDGQLARSLGTGW